MAKPKKYAALVGQLAKRIPEGDRKALVDAAISEIQSATERHDDTFADVSRDIEALFKRLYGVALRASANKHTTTGYASAYVEMRDIADIVNAWQKSLGVLLEAYETLLLGKLEDENVESIRVNGRSISTSPRPYSQIKDAEAYRQWCIEQGLERKMQLPWATTNALVSQMLLQGEDTPPGIEVFIDTQVSLRS